MLAHAMLARVVPEFAIDVSEATELARAFCNYARHTEAIAMSPRTRDLGALILCVGMVEGPRVLRVAARRKAETRAARQEAATRAAAPGGTIVNMGARPAGL